MYPKTYFEDGSDEVQLGRAFLVMPFAAKFDDVFEALSEIIRGDKICFNCLRADELFGGGHILNDVLREIAKAEIVVADVTDRNPNVFYELGIVHTVKRASKVILITQSLDDVPFDIRQYRCIEYVADADGLRKLQSEIVTAFDQVAEDSFTVIGEHNKELVCERRFLGPDRCLYSFSIPELFVGDDVAKFRTRVVRQVVGQEEAVFDERGWGMHVNEAITIPGFGWRLILERADADRATFRIAKGEAILPRE